MEMSIDLHGKYTEDLSLFSLQSEKDASNFRKSHEINRTSVKVNLSLTQGFEIVFHLSLEVKIWC